MYCKFNCKKGFGKIFVIVNALNGRGYVQNPININYITWESRVFLISSPLITENAQMWEHPQIRPKINHWIRTRRLQELFWLSTKVSVYSRKVKTIWLCFSNFIASFRIIRNQNDLGNPIMLWSETHLEHPN